MMFLIGFLLGYCLAVVQLLLKDRPKRRWQWLVRLERRLNMAPR
jgi:hypothetical protein